MLAAGLSPLAGFPWIGYNFRLFRAETHARNPVKVIHHETYFPAVERPPQEDAWLSRAHEDGERARDHQRAPCQGPQARRRLRRSCIATPGRMAFRGVIASPSAPPSVRC